MKGGVFVTLRQEAYSLLDRMPDENIRILIPVMAKLIPLQKNQSAANSVDSSPKMQAFLDMQEMRKTAVKYDFSEAERDAAIAEKYGDIRWGTTK